MSESDLQKAVIELAKRLGYRVAHFRPALTKSGKWMTAVQGDGAGFPDLVLARRGVVVFAELKSAKGRVGFGQACWLADLPNAYVWRPQDWLDGTVERVLREARSEARAAA